MWTQLAIFGAQYLYLLVVLLAVMWWWRQPTDRRIPILTLVPVVFLLIYLARLIAGNLYYDPLPLESPDFPVVIPHPPGNGFPSDHTLLCSAIAFVATYYRSWFAVVLWFLTLFVAASRVYLGLHHVSDVLFSAVIAVSIGWIAWAVLLPIFKSRFMSQEN